METDGRGNYLDNHNKSLLKLLVYCETLFTVAGLQGLSLSLAFPLGMPTHQCRADLKAEMGGEKPLYLHSQILVCIYSSTIKNSRVSQLTFAKAHKRLSFCLLL